MKRRPWSEPEKRRVRVFYPDVRTADLARVLGRPVAHVYAMATLLGVVKSDAYLAGPFACRLRRGDNVGAATRFKPGHVPANKGLRRPGWYRGRMRQTQFKKGYLNGRAARLYQPIGAERINEDGYRERKVTDEGRGAQRWKAVHVLLWIAHHGPVPPGHSIVFRNKDKTDIRIENLECISRAELMARNTIHRYPDELKKVIRLHARLKRTIGDAREKQAHRSEEPPVRDPGGAAGRQKADAARSRQGDRGRRADRHQLREGRGRVHQRDRRRTRARQRVLRRA